MPPAVVFMALLQLMLLSKKLPASGIATILTEQVSIAFNVQRALLVNSTTLRRTGWLHAQAQCVCGVCR